MDIRSLNIFIQVAELGSFTRAGERLGYSQPTISFQIKQLEQELGVQLFDRIGHTVSLTDAGHSALNYAQQICRTYQQMIQGSDPQQVTSGIVRLAMPDSLCTPLIENKFDEFHTAYPHVSLHLSTCATDELFRLLDHNEVDVVCTLDSRICSANYVVASEEQIGVHFVASAHNPLAQKEQLRMEDLLTQPFLLTEQNVSYGRLLRQRLARDGIELHPILETGNADLLCRLAEQDIGIAFLPDYITERSIREGRTVKLPIDGFEIELWNQVIYRRDKWMTLPMQAVIRHLSNISLQA